MWADIPSEIFWLALVAAYTNVMWAPYAFVRVRRIGWLRVFVDPLPGDDPLKQPWAARTYRGHMNAIENLAVFGPLAIGAVVSGASNEITETACQVYFWARLLHYPVYIFKTPWTRLPTYMAGVVACLVLAYQIVV